MKHYLVRHAIKELYLDEFGYLSEFHPVLTADFDTKKAAKEAYRNGKTSACCVIVERGKDHGKK